MFSPEPENELKGLSLDLTSQQMSLPPTRSSRRRFGPWMARSLGSKKRMQRSCSKKFKNAPNKF